jgi:hypothetical protein
MRSQESVADVKLQSNNKTSSGDAPWLKRLI